MGHSQPTMPRDISDDVKEKAQQDHVERQKELYPTDEWQDRYKDAVGGRA